MRRTVSDVSPWGRALLLLAAFALLVLSITGPAHELCIGDDGHFAIEPRHAQCPTRPAAPTGSADTGLAAASEQLSAAEGDCLDVSLRADLPPDTGTRAKLPVPDAAPACGAPYALVLAAVEMPRPAAFVARAPTRPPTLAALRTVVFRC